MADNPRLTIELLDRSGASGVSSTNPAQSGSANIPGTDIASDFQKKITEQGAGGSAGTPSSTGPTTDSIGTALDNQTRQNNSALPTTPSGYQGPTAGNMSFANAVAGLYQSDPSISPQEISGFLGISSKEAQELLDRAKGNNSPPPPPTPPPPPIPSSPTSPMGSDPYGGLGGSFNPLPSQRRGPITDPITGEVLEPSNPRSTPPESGYDGLPQTTNYQPLSGPAVDPITGRPQDIPSSKRPDDGFGELPEASMPSTAPRPARRDVEVDPATGIETYVAEAVDAQSPPNASRDQINSVIKSAMNLTGLSQVPGASSAGSVLASIGSQIPISAATMATVGAGLGIATAAVGLAAGAYYTLDNEARRAVALSQEYSSDVINAQAIAEVDQIMANMRTARTLGDEAADYIENSSRLSRASQGLRDTISEPILQRFNQGMDKISKLAEALDNVTKEGAGKAILQEGVGALTDEGIAQILGPFGSLYRANQMMARFAEKEDKEENIQDWFNGIMPHLEPPAPFNNVSNEMPFMNPIPGLNFT